MSQLALTTDGVPLTRLTGWGRTHVSRSRVVTPSSTQDMVGMLGTPRSGPFSPRGLGSSYGDAATVDGGTSLLMTARHRVTRLDDEAGLLVAESGATLGELQATVLDHGWCLPVLPGTGEVTLGGAVAADIHGKNHPAVGSLGRHIAHLTVLGNDLRPRRLSAHDDPEQFWATVGGLGLTGPILEVALALRRVGHGPARTTRLRAATTREVMRLVDEAHGRSDDVHAVAWLDPTSPAGRGLVDVTILPAPDEEPVRRAHPGHRPDPAAGVPRARQRPALPGPGLVGRPTIVAASRVRWYTPTRTRRSRTIPRALMPLGSAEQWPRLFGRRGLTQYQYVVPASAADAITEGLHLLAHLGLTPALAVLKRMGAGDPAPLGFALDGWTLALDLPTRSPGLDPALDALDRLVVEAGGRVYLAKDRRLSPEAFRAMYPFHTAWSRTRDVMDPRGRYSSDLSRRLHLTSRPNTEDPR